MGGRLNLSQGELENGGAVAGQGPGPQPAAIAAIINADDLIHLAVFAAIRQFDAVALMKIGGGACHGCGAGDLKQSRDGGKEGQGKERGGGGERGI